MSVEIQYSYMKLNTDYVQFFGAYDFIMCTIIIVVGSVIYLSFLSRTSLENKGLQVLASGIINNNKRWECLNDCELTV